MVPLPMTLSGPTPSFKVTIVRRRISCKRCMLWPATWRHAGFSAIAEVSCITVSEHYRELSDSGKWKCYLSWLHAVCGIFVFSKTIFQHLIKPSFVSTAMLKWHVILGISVMAFHTFSGSKLQCRWSWSKQQAQHLQRLWLQQLHVHMVTVISVTNIENTYFDSM